MSDRSDRGRRAALRRMAVLTGGTAIAGAAAWTGCARPEKDASVRVPLSSLPEGQRVRIEVGGLPVEVLRTVEGIAARSLVCTHMGCVVRWEEALSRYRCPCHNGQFDASGAVIQGPPPRPLRPVAFTVTDGVVVLRPLAVVG
jgi:nitrite reductase/ring-hydroxylating ferredoxin subunit